jgi:hypothetical protein
MKLCDVLFLSIIAACLLSLCGCHDNSEPFPIIAGPPTVLRNWSPQEECKLAAALAPIPENSIIWTMHDDWARMRRETSLKPRPVNNKCKEAIDEFHLLS